MHEFWIQSDDVDQGYRNIRDGDSEFLRERLQSLWDRFSCYLDNDFRQDFARKPDNRFWEFYICQRLIENRKSLVRMNGRSKDGPDFLVEDVGGRVWIEAVTFEHGSDANPDRVPELVYDGKIRKVPVAEVELRISQAFDVKSKKVKKYIEGGLVNRDDRVLIAINPARVAAQSSEQGRGSPFCVLYPFGDLQQDFLAGQPYGPSYFRHRLYIERKSGASVEIGMFASAKHQHISGVIWSRATIQNFYFGKRPLVYYPNSQPTNSLNPNWMNWDLEWSVSLDRSGNFIISPL
ncbi:MAG: hypothetical protein AAFR46_00680 [Pseudomonadota bacterium]